MTELEKMRQAKSYMDKLADGIDPITGAEMPENSVLNNVRLSRCFFFVSDILRQAIDNGGRVGAVKSVKRDDFSLSEETMRSFPFSGQPVSISAFASVINGLIDVDSMKKLTTTVITGWLLDKGFLELREYPDGKKTRQPTKQGEYIGLSTELRDGKYGEYRVVLYNEDAQRFVIDNLDAMLSYKAATP